MVTLTVNLDEKTAENLASIAQRMGISSAALTEKAIQQYLRLEAEKKILLEREAFEAQRQQLLAQYEGQYVAMHDSQVIDHGLEELALLLRVREKHPLTGILIKQVTAQPDAVLQFRSPRFEYQ